MSVFGFLSKKKIKRLPKSWQFYTKTSRVDFGFKTKSPYETFDEEAQNLWLYALSYLRTHDGRKQGKESFMSVTSKKLTLYVYHFDDGRKDCNGRWVSNWLMVFLTPEETKKYTIKDFLDEIYEKKSKLGITYPTGFDLANKFPVVWDESKPMESNDKHFLNSHKNAQGGDFAFTKEEFHHDNLIWQGNKKENATILSTTYAERGLE